MDTHKNLMQENELAHQFYKKEPLATTGNEDKRTIDEEADLTAEEVEQMEHHVANKGTQSPATSDADKKGSSGPEEKDIAV
jgi:hypothetical protein